MLTYEVQNFTRRCATTERELKAGEEYYSCLVVDGGSVTRHDYCRDAWDGPPSRALGWWKARIPQPTSRKISWAPNDVMLNYFLELVQNPDAEDVRYILALLMTRRRVFRLEEVTSVDGRECMRLFCPRNECEYSVPVITPAPDRIVDIQNELAALLYGNSS